ncbi:MAG: ATP-binding protein [Actinobacteria bacterium]|nr:ATP-binding protein [Actinomycetota bacterium]
MAHFDQPTLITIPAKPEYVSVVRLVVAAFADLLDYDGDAVEDIKLAVSEACTNAILQLHKQAPPDKHLLTMSAYIKDERMLIDIIYFVGEEAGAEFASRQLHERDLGMSILVSIMDKVEIARASPDGVIIRLTKNVPARLPE